MICDRCGREQPVLFSPCPACGLLGSASSIPCTPAVDGQRNAVRPQRGGEAEPSKPMCRSGETAAAAVDEEPTSGGGLSLVKDSPQMSRALVTAFTRAHRGWALRYAPHLLKEFTP